MKYAIMSAVRALGLLPAADSIKFVQRRAASARGNIRFLAEHPGFVPPPANLAFDAYNTVDWAAYHDGGRLHAEVFAEAILARTDGHALRVLEWGCGPGRLIRHMPELLGDRADRIAGTDYNPETIDWCTEHLPAIDFTLNDLMPPLAFPDDYFDAAYNFSVFTHLSEEAQRAWAAELRRVLKPGGVLLSTTHGDAYRYLLARNEEQARYDSGHVVTQAQYGEGKKWYFAIHPPRFVRDALLAGYEQVEQLTVPPSAGMKQDLWCARKPAA